MPQIQSISIEEIIKYLFSNKIKLISFPIILSILIAIASLFIENEYKSQANLLPSRAPNMGFSLFSNEGGISSLASSFLGQSSDEVNKYYVLLESYSTKEAVIDKFDLVAAYDQLDAEFPIINTIEILNENTSFELREEGNFVIQVWDKDPTRAKDMADFYVQLLNQRNIEISTTEARVYRAFIEERYNNSIEILDSLRSDMVSLQSKYGVIELPEQVLSYFTVIADLTAQQYQAEIKFDLIKENSFEDSFAYKTAEQELNTITQKLKDTYSNTSNNDILLNFNELPEIASQYYDLMMKLEIEGEIQKFIVPLYEQAKMEEAKSLPIVSIVDAPRIAEKKDRPRRSLIVIFSAVSVFILTTLYFIIRLHFIKNKDYYNALFTEST